MSITRETSHGTITIRVAMFGGDGTNLEEGLEIRVDGDLILEEMGKYLHSFEEDEMSDDELETYIDLHY
jgi:hypothetical protein